MSINVTLEELPEVVQQRGDAVFVCTVSDQLVTHLSHTRLTLDNGRFECEVGGTSRRNVAERPAIVLLWPSREPGDYSLIVDGSATVAEHRLVIDPQSAVLHRPAVEAD